MGTKAYVLAEGEGKAIWFANALMLVKAATEETAGRFAFLDQHVPGDYAVPRHVHHAEDEAFYLLDGDVTFYCGEETFQASKGSWIFLPKDVPHAFKVGPAGARMLTFSAPSGFADFVEECGVLAPSRTIPPQEPLDVERLATIAARYQVEIVGPPPA